MGVLLQGRDGPSLCDGALDSCLQGARLMVSIAQDHHLLGRHNGTHTNGQGVLRHLVDIVVEETRVSDDGVGGQRLHAGAAGEA